MIRQLTDVMGRDISIPAGQAGREHHPPQLTPYKKTYERYYDRLVFYPRFLNCLLTADDPMMATFAIATK